MQNNLDFFKFLLENDPRMTNSAPDVYPYFGTSTDTAPVMVSVADTQQYAIEPDYAMQDVPLEADNPTYSGRSLGVGTSGGAQGTSGGGSSGTDFRRRRNWPERILNEITGFLYVLSPVGKLLHCSKSSVELTGYTAEELVGQSLTDFLHVDDIDVFIRGFNRAFQTRSQIKMIYRFRKKDESYAVFETIGHPRTDVPGQPPQSFFALAQPYPTRMSGLLDSFLELKMENEWLKQRLREVSAMEQETMDSPSTSQQARFADASTIQRARRLSQAAEAAGSATATTGMHPGIFQAVTEDSNANPLWATADEKATSNEFETLMPLYGQNDLDMPSLPSAAGLTSSAHTGASKVVESGDTGGQKWKRRKKNRGVDDYVCADCGTTSSPEWRKGPHGPKTLCNACGLRWAKKSKKKDTNND